VKLRLTNPAVWTFSKINYQWKFQDVERCKIKPWNGLLKMRNSDLRVTWWEMNTGWLGRSSSAEQGESNNNNNNNNNCYYVITSSMMKPQMMVMLKLHVLLQIMKEIYACILCYVMEINVTFLIVTKTSRDGDDCERKGMILNCERQVTFNVSFLL